MNRNSTAALALLLAMAATYGSWRYAWNGPAYARVLRVTPVTVDEPRYADVVEAVPVPAGAASEGLAHPPRWDVSYRLGGALQRTRTRAEPGDQVRVGRQRRVIGYDVVWRWRERTGVARMSTHPGRRLPVVDGEVSEARPSGRG